MPLNGETISFAGTLGKRVTTKTKTDDTQCEGKRDSKSKRQRKKEMERERERESNEKRRWETRSPPKVTEDSPETVEKTERVGERGGRKGSAVEETETRGRVAFNSIS